MRFPGLYCPGLIEAQSLDVCGGNTESRFRGSIAPASLKPSNRIIMVGYSPTFPGLYCPGLIEARRHDGDAVGAVRAVSGALLPRPH